MVIILATTAAALLLAGVGILSADSVLFRASLQRDLAALAGIIADNSSATILFDDPKAAAETLGALRARPHMRAACIFRPNGTVFASYPRTADSSNCPRPEAQDQIQSTPDGLVVSQHIEIKGGRAGTLTMLYDLGELYERMRIYGSTVLGVLVAASLLALMLSSRLRDIIADPIAQLVSATTAVTEAPDYSIRAKSASRDELGVLVDAFNRMLSGIQSRDRELRQALVDREAALHDADAARKQLQLITDTMAASVTRCNRDRRYIWVSRRYAEWLTRTPEEIAGRSMVEVLGPEGYETLRPYVDRVLAGERTAYQAPVKYSDLGVRWVDAVYVPTFDRSGAVDGWVAHVADITGMKQVQADLRKSNERLARSNEDLERFAFVASHDLQEPLRMITTYAQLLIRAYPAELDSEAGVFVANIVEGTRRMRSLLSDLLAYSEIGAGNDEPPQTVDLNEVIETVKQNLKAAIDETGAVIVSDGLPVLAAHESQIVPLFQNLVGNAIKYRSVEPPRICITVQGVDGGWQFAVADNGMGIAPEYHEKIFGVFKRLHGKKIPGTGIGLAICQRVVERYGGRIWVQSQAGQGATFFFTLPGRVR